MVTGEKKEEFRLQSKWIESRLIDSATGKDKQYDRVKFVNGYGKHRPSFTVSFKGYKLEANGVHKRYSNGLEVDSRAPHATCCPACPRVKGRLRSGRTSVHRGGCY